MAKRNKKNQNRAAKILLDGIRYTSSVMPDKHLDQVSDEDRDWMDDIFSRLQTEAEDLEDDLETLRQRYPEIICLENWLCLCYRRSGRKDEARSIYERQLRERPDYLFARTSLAEICLEEGDVEAAESLMRPDTETLTSFYPGREVFHVSELRHWFSVLGKLAFFRQCPDETRLYRDALRKLEPNSPFAEELDNMLGPKGAELQLISQMIHHLKSLSESERAEIASEIKKRMIEA